MSAPAEQDMKPATADAIRFMGTTFAIPSFVSLADALDALAAANVWDELQDVIDDIKCGRVSEPWMAERLEAIRAAIQPLTGATRS